MLRKEKNITQKSAAGALGVSQALLSHYEKGIRECNLDFVTKAAQYYGVSTDYLLGVTELRQSAGVLLGDAPAESDENLEIATLLRALRFLHTAAAGAGEQRRFLNYFALRLREYGNGLSGGAPFPEEAYLLAARRLTRGIAPEAARQAAPANAPQACRTAFAAADACALEALRALAARAPYAGESTPGE